MRSIIDFDEGWHFLEERLTKNLRMISEGPPGTPFSTSEEFVKLYTVVYDMCTQKFPYDYSEQLYWKYKELLDDYIRSMVLPSLRDTYDDFMLKELVKRWASHKYIVKHLSLVFHYLERYFICRRSYATLEEVGLACFRDLVYEVFKYKARDCIITMTNQDRDGELIDRALLKNALDIFVEMGMGLHYYKNDFENAFLNDTVAYYSRKASRWISEDSCTEYIFKVEQCLHKEKERVFYYLHSSSETKLLEKVQNELLLTYANQLLDYGFHALLRDNKMEDLSRMYRLFHRIDKALEHIVNMFKQHVTFEGMVMIQQVEDTARHKAVAMKLIELENKYSAYISDCFYSNSLFHKALNEAFEDVTSKVVGGGTSGAELLALYHDNNILTKDVNGKLSDEANMEITVEPDYEYTRLLRGLKI